MAQIQHYAELGVNVTFSAYRFLSFFMFYIIWAKLPERKWLIIRFIAIVLRLKGGALYLRRIGTSAKVHKA